MLAKKMPFLNGAYLWIWDMQAVSLGFSEWSNQVINYSSC